MEDDSIEPGAEETAPEETPEATEVPVEVEEPADEKTDEQPVIDLNSELLKKIEKLEARVGYLNRRAEKQERPEHKTVAETPTDLVAPKESDFDTFEEYEEARIDYKLEVKLRAKEQAMQRQAETAELSQFVNTMVKNGQERYSDFEEIAQAPTLPLTQQMLEIMREHENSHDVAYYLGKNIKEAISISKMSPIQQTRALDNIANKVKDSLAVAPERAPSKIKTISDAPPPVKPSGSANVVTKDPEKMTQQEYEAWRSAGGGR